MNTPLNSIPSRGAVSTASGSPRMGRLVRRSFTAMTPVERTRVLAMYGVIAGLHLAGFFILFVFVLPSHYKGLGIGVAVGLLNLVILAGIARVFVSMRRGEYDEAELERQLEARGLFYRFFGRWMKAISKEWQLYPVGVLFGLGFDTATEVALLATTALLASGHIPWYAIACLPVLFTAGMTLMDTTDGLFMNLAYGWAFFNPVRKVYYNLAITGLSVAICFFIGGIETLSLFPQEIKGLSHDHGFWALVARFNLNTAGFVIVGMFLVTWLAALLIWRYARIEEKWGARLQSVPSDLPAQSLEHP